MINIKNLTFGYKKKSPLFTDFSLEIGNGQIVGLFGGNGAGKSTLFNMIAGLLPVGGSISVNEHTPFERLPEFLEDVYLVPEEFSFPSTSIRNYTKAYSIFYPNFDHEKLENMLIEFELRYEYNLNKLSHGQRKKFLIAFALSTNCSILLLDEPTNGLDIPSKSQFRKILVGAITEKQSVIISTHQVKDIDSIIDSVIVLNDGKVVFKESVDEILQKYYFEIVPSLQNEENVLFSEKCPSGYRIIKHAVENESSVIDMELFFNAVINNKLN